MAAAATATAMIAYQVGAKATRDAFFLSNFPVTSLPAMMVGSSILAIAVALPFTRALTVRGPERLIPGAFAISAALLLIEWAISFAFQRVAAVLLYLHYGGLGALLISGFWSLVNERFDPHTAKRKLGRITAGGTIGGLLGGLVASQVGRGLPVTTMIPILAALHLICAGTMARLRLPASALGPTAAGQNPESSGLRTLARTPYLRGLIALVLLVTISEGLVDLVLKGRASERFGAGGDLLQFFAVFYAGISLLTVFVQAGASRRALEKLGPARAAAILPTGVALAAAGALLRPGLSSVIITRGLDSILSNSLYRAGYEVLFTPVPAREKRSIKPLVDVGASRVGDMVAAGIAQAVLLLAMPLQGTALLIGALILSVIAVGIAYRLQDGYVQTLERGLVSRAVQLDISAVQDVTTRTTVLRALGPLALSQILTRPDVEALGVPGEPARDAEGREDPDRSRIVELRSRNVARVLRALRSGPLPVSLVSDVIPLLAWDDVAREAIDVLRRVGPDAIDLLVSRLTDPDEEFTIRRRIPLILGTYRDRAAVRGLLRGLSDRRFEVRYRCGRALSHLLDLDPASGITREEAFGAVLREVEAGAGVWESRNLLDRLDDESWSPVVDEVVRERANRSLEHIFTLLALVLPRQPLRIAFKGLHTDDPLLRGTALEYLESSLPPEIRRPLWPYLEDSRARRPERSRPPEEVLHELLESSESIIINLEELRKSRKERETTDG